MAILIELSPERQAVLQEQARARGLTLQQLLLEIVEQQMPSAPVAVLQRSNPAEWARQFRAWADHHDPAIPVLTDAAMDRESIYPDRI